MPTVLDMPLHTVLFIVSLAVGVLATWALVMEGVQWVVDLLAPKLTEEQRKEKRNE